jgi:hypothetical protein
VDKAKPVVKAVDKAKPVVKANGHREVKGPNS